LVSKWEIPLYLAPMARFTDIVFREFCKEQGADVMVTEFVQADALTRDDPKLWETVDFTEAQRPMGVQIFRLQSRVDGKCRADVNGSLAARLYRHQLRLPR
jgi:tRNA-dihydrouridine synthase B